MVSWVLEPIWEISDSLLLDLMLGHSVDIAFVLGSLVGIDQHSLAVDLGLVAAVLH
jgi:hypothetical protein